MSRRGTWRQGMRREGEMERPAVEGRHNPAGGGLRLGENPGEVCGVILDVWPDVLAILKLPCCGLLRRCCWLMVAVVVACGRPGGTTA